MEGNDGLEVVAMAGMISVTPDELRVQARVYLDAREMIVEAKRKVDEMNRQMGQQWRGEAFQAYLGQFDQLAHHVRGFNELLGRMYQQLNHYADVNQERDRADARAFGFNEGVGEFR